MCMSFPHSIARSTLNPCHRREHAHPLSLRGAQRRGNPETASIAIAASKAFSHKCPQSPLPSTLTPLSLRGAQRRGNPQPASVAIAARKAFSHKCPQSPLPSTLTPCHCEERSDVAIPKQHQSPSQPVRLSLTNARSLPSRAASPLVIARSAATWQSPIRLVLH